MTQYNASAFKQEAQRQGIYLANTITTVKDQLAMDADPQPQMSPNGGIPDVVSTWVDPNIIKTVFAPNMATTILSGEEKKGAFAQDVVMIGRSEGTGYVAAYDDYSNQGANQVNLNWVTRQVYRYQSPVTYGQLEQERYGLAMVPYVAMKQQQAIDTLNRASNLFYFYGVSGLDNYGILNDPSLYAPISPDTVGTATLWADKAVVDKFNDIKKMFKQLVKQTNGTVGDGVTMSSRLKLCMSNELSTELVSSNEIFATSLQDMLTKAFPNMEIVTAPQYSTDAGELIQMFVENVGGQKTGYGAYNEKLRTSNLVVHETHYTQKYFAGTYGTIWQSPYAVVQMLGV